MFIVITREKINEIDADRICDAYNKWPEIAKDCFENNSQKIDLKEIRNVIFVGMGGSGTVGDVISSIFSRTNIHVSVVKGYVLPKTVDKNTLIVIISVSGDTDESVTVLKNASVLPLGDHEGPSVKYPSDISLSPLPLVLIKPMKNFFL